MKLVFLEEHLSDNVSWLEWYLRSSWESLYNNQCSLSARRTFATDGERKETQAVLGGGIYWTRSSHFYFKRLKWMEVP